jgi:hypothetical protein
LAGDFVGFAELMIEDLEDARVEADGDGVGMLRTVTIGGDELVERLEVRDQTGWQTSYSMLARIFREMLRVTGCR